jgi:hypothetical protein
MPLVMLFIDLHLAEHLRQQRQLTLLQMRTQSYFPRPIRGQLLLAQHKFNTLWLAAVVALAV